MKVPRILSLSCLHTFVIDINPTFKISLETGWYLILRKEIRIKTHKVHMWRIIKYGNKLQAKDVTQGLLQDEILF